jgi:type IV secretory pathway VirB4 component
MTELTRLDSRGLVETVGLSTILESFVPGTYPNFKRAHFSTSSYLACMIPFSASEIHKSGIEFTSLSGEAVYIDIFNLYAALNFNGLITGKSGSGKSVIAQKMLLDSLESGVKGLILDKGQSFRKLTLYCGGNIFSEKFNPLQFKNPHYLKAFLMSLIPEAELSIKDQGRLFSLVKEYVSTDEKPTFSKLVEFLENSFEGIRHYFTELSDFITDSEIRVTDITYVDTALYPKKIIGPLIIYLIEYFKNINGKKIFLFDECWEYLERNSDYIEECFRTFRKHNASAIAITQDVADFLSSNSKVGQVIYNNTNHKFFFYQDTTNSPLLNEEDAQRIRSLKSVQGSHSEFFYKDDSVRKTARFYATPLEYELFTTKKEDNLKFEKYASVYGDYLDFKTLIHNWVDFKYYHGGMNATH